MHNYLLFGVLFIVFTLSKQAPVNDSGTKKDAELTKKQIQPESERTENSDEKEKCIDRDELLCKMYEDKLEKLCTEPPHAESVQKGCCESCKPFPFTATTKAPVIDEKNGFEDELEKFKTKQNESENEEKKDETEEKEMDEGSGEAEEEEEFDPNCFDKEPRTCMYFNHFEDSLKDLCTKFPHKDIMQKGCCKTCKQFGAGDSEGAVEQSGDADLF